MCVGIIFFSFFNVHFRNNILGGLWVLKISLRHITHILEKAKFLSQFEQRCTLSLNERLLFLPKQIGIDCMLWFKVGWRKRSCFFFL